MVIYGPFCDRGEWRIRWKQELYDIYDDIDVVKRIKIQRLAPTQFVESSNLSQLVDVADKDDLPRIRSNSLMRI